MLCNAPMPPLPFDLYLCQEEFIYEDYIHNEPIGFNTPYFRREEASPLFRTSHALV